jgi:hypothetical protein
MSSDQSLNKRILKPGLLSLIFGAFTGIPGIILSRRISQQCAFSRVEILCCWLGTWVTLLGVVGGLAHHFVRNSN